MLDVTKRHRHESDLRTIILFEFVAASVVLALVVLVLYMVFTYRPA